MRYLQRLRAVTPARVREVANQWLVKPHAEILTKPAPQPAGAPPGAGGPKGPGPGAMPEKPASPAKPKKDTKTDGKPADAAAKEG